MGNSNFNDRSNSSATRIEHCMLDLIVEGNALADMTCDTLSDSIAMIDRFMHPEEYGDLKIDGDPIALLSELRSDLSSLLRRYDSTAIGASARPEGKSKFRPAQLSRLHSDPDRTVKTASDREAGTQFNPQPNKDQQ